MADERVEVVQKARSAGGRPPLAEPVIVEVLAALDAYEREHPTALRMRALEDAVAFLRGEQEVRPVDSDGRPLCFVCRRPQSAHPGGVECAVPESTGQSDELSEVERELALAGALGEALNLLEHELEAGVVECVGCAKRVIEDGRSVLDTAPEDAMVAITVALAASPQSDHGPGGVSDTQLHAACEVVHRYLDGGFAETERPGPSDVQSLIEDVVAALGVQEERGKGIEACGRIMVGYGGEGSHLPTCKLPKGHEGMCVAGEKASRGSR